MTAEEINSGFRWHKGYWKFVRYALKRDILVWRFKGANLVVERLNNDRG